MRPAPPLSAAVVLATASWELAQATPIAGRMAPGLWWWLDRFGAIGPFAHLLPVLAAGAIVAALVQPFAHVRHARPWAQAILLALLVAGLLLPVPLAVLFAALAMALCSNASRLTLASLVLAIVVPSIGPAAIGVAIWRLSLALRLPPHANDNVPAAIRA